MIRDRELGRFGEQEVFIIQAGAQEAFRAFVEDQVKPVAPDADESEEAFLQVAAVRGGLVGADAGYSSTWKPTTRLQSIDEWAAKAARNSFWLGAAAKRQVGPVGLGVADSITHATASAAARPVATRSS